MLEFLAGPVVWILGLISLDREWSWPEPGVAVSAEGPVAPSSLVGVDNRWRKGP